MSRLKPLRERAKSQTTPELDAALTAFCLAGPAWLLAHGFAGAGWGWAILCLFAGPLAMAVAFVVVAAIFDGALGKRRSELAGTFAAFAGAIGWWLSHYRLLGLIPLGVAATGFLMTWFWPKPSGLSHELAMALAALPEELPPSITAALERAAADSERLEATLREDLIGDTAVDAIALRADIMAALRAMADRARLAARLDEAARTGSAKLEAAASEARNQIDALAGQISSATEALLLYAAARQPAGADELRSRANDLRATTAGLQELEALERA